MERQNKMGRIVWVLKIAEETLKKILNPIAWEVYFPIHVRKSPTVIPSIYFRFACLLWL